MYDFIKECKENCQITSEDIKKIELEWGISFLDVLKDFYLKYNGAGIHLCEFKMESYDFGVAKIVPLVYGKSCLEKLIENDRIDGFIPKSMVPLARNEGGDYYYWDNSSGKVYLFYCDDIENEIFISESVDEFFDIMNKNID